MVRIRCKPFNPALQSCSESELNNKGRKFHLFLSMCLKKKNKCKNCKLATEKNNFNLFTMDKKFKIEQKGMPVDHDFCCSFSFSSSLFFQEGREKGKILTKVVVKSHAFLLDQSLSIIYGNAIGEFWKELLTSLSLFTYYIFIFQIKYHNQ